MWILETDGDIFQGKRLWLRPGKRFLFGRTRAGEGDFAVADKTISRSHLLVEVAAVDPQECGNPRSRSRITITDQATKIGTTLNGVQIKSEKDNKVGHILDQEVNAIVLGKYPHEFRISWKPVTFTFSFTSKEHKANPYPALYKRLGPLDVKVLVEYEVGNTTHVAARKRNTAKGLQALVDGKYIVNNETYMKALELAATSNDGSCPLEIDFDKNFPNPLEYLPAKGDEPTTRDASAYAPNLSRKEMFDGYTFVFYEKRQYDNLMAPITTGKGKALLHAAIPDETQVLDFVRYVKNVAGEKGLGEFEDGSAGRGVVVVRFNPVKGEGTEWFRNFSQQVSIHLGHRFVEQNEFLDAILGNDASVLRQPLEEPDPSGIAAPAPSIVSNVNTQRSLVAPQPQPPTATEVEASSQITPLDFASIRGRGRRAQSRFKGFDDNDDNFSSIPVTSSNAPPPARQHIQPESQGLFVSQDPEAEITAPRRSETPPPVRPTRKRNAQSDDPFGDTIAPAVTAVKRRKLAEESARRLRGESTPPPVQASTEPEPKKEEPPTPAKPKSKKNGISKADADAMEAARLKAERLARAKEEALEAKLDGIPTADMRNLAIVETMPIGRTKPVPERGVRADESERWDDKWNGRKNFKRFKRRGGEEGGARVRKVIVRLEEAKTRDYGIGEDYWLERKEDNQRRKKKKSKEMQDESLLPETLSQTRVGKTREPAPTRTTRSEQVVEDEDDDMDVDEELAAAAAKVSKEVPSSSDVEVVASRPSTRGVPTGKPTSSSASTATMDRTARSQASTATTSQRLTQTLSDKTNKSQNLPTGSSGSGSKRPAASTSSGSKQPPSKKVKGLFARRDESDEDSDDDGLGFKFRRRR